MMYDEYVDRVTEVVTGIVQQAGDRNNVLVDLGKVEALLPRSEQVDGERYEQGSRIKAVITEVRSGTKGPQVILSRRDPELIRTLFELEVPEIADGLVEIRGVAREPGLPLEDRRRVARPGRRPGRRLRRAARLARAHGRLRAARREDRHHPVEHRAGALHREGALACARARGLVDDETKEATVIVPDDQLALAIGKEGLNARLAARLTGWKVDIQSDAEFAQAEAEAAFAGGDAGEEFSGRCVGDPRQRQALPERRIAGLALLRHRRAPRARAREAAARSWRRRRSSAGQRRARGGGSAEEIAEAAAASPSPESEPSRGGSEAEEPQEARVEPSPSPPRRRRRDEPSPRDVGADPDLHGVRPEGAEGRARSASSRGTGC